jgi:hypothetical protein
MLNSVQRPDYLPRYVDAEGRASQPLLKLPGIPEVSRLFPRTHGQTVQR